MELFDIPVEQVVENPWNANLMDSIRFDALVESMRLHPELLEASRHIVRKKGGKYEILGGVHRFRAAIANGFNEIPVGSLGEIDDAEARLISLMLNNRGEEDFDKKLDVVRSLVGEFTVESIAKQIGESENLLSSLVEGIQHTKDTIYDEMAANPPTADVTSPVQDMIDDMPEPPAPIVLPKEITVPIRGNIARALVDSTRETMAFKIINDACKMFVEVNE
jgi:ParB-like chromosome segregation protein Spo0J